MPSRETGGIVEGDFIKLDGHDSVIQISTYIKLVDVMLKPFSTPGGKLGAYIDQVLSKYYPELAIFIPWEEILGAGYKELGFPIINPPQVGGGPIDVVSLKWIYENAGLPGAIDTVKSISTKRDEWVAQGLEELKIDGDTQINVGDNYLPLLTFELWKLMFDRMNFSYPDTAFSTYRSWRDNLFLNGIRNLNILNNMNRADMMPLNKYINTFVYLPESKHITLGAYFFEPNGMPVMDEDNNITNGNNVILLSKFPGYEKLGEFTPRRFVKIIDGVNIQFENKISIVVADPFQYEIMCGIKNDINNPDSIIPLNIDFPQNPNTNVTNTIFHEFSHNYLLDEYTVQIADLGSESQAEQIRISNRVERTNLQTGLGLAVSRPPLTGKTGMGDNIKWLWPRVKIIAYTIDNPVHIQLDTYSLNIGQSYPPKIYTGLQVGDTILLRKRDLFKEYSYYRFKITSLPVQSGNPYILELLGDHLGNKNIDLAQYPGNSLIILPYWRNANEYDSLVEPSIITKINGTGGIGQPLVSVDNISDNGVGAKQSPPPDPIINRFNKPENIVGLFAGGDMLYNEGLYHPTGFCLMRKTHTGMSNYYCHVCKYILVDAIDPLIHPIIDKEYKGYPRT